MKADIINQSEHVMLPYWISRRSFYILEHMAASTLNDLIAAKAWTPKAGRRIPRFRTIPGGAPSRLYCSRADYNAWRGTR